MSSSIFRLGQVLRGTLGRYIIKKEIQDTAWFAKSQIGETVVIKGVWDHPRPFDPQTIVLKYLEDHLLDSSIKQTLNPKKLKYVARRILEALKVLHEDGYVHTDVKLDNVFVNYREGDIGFSDVQLGDLGGTYPADSEWAKGGTPVGATMWNSTKLLWKRRGIPQPTFGHLGLCNFSLFRPRTVPYGHAEYGSEVLKRQFQYFGPFPPKIREIASPVTAQTILWLMQEIPFSKLAQFYRTTEREVCKEDKVFIGKIMMLDWTPTAKVLLEDGWFKEDMEEQ